ncbi:hypothetical protein HK102_003347, partial [Quaeritorhiza haematococci]
SREDEKSEGKLPDGKRLKRAPTTISELTTGIRRHGRGDERRRRDRRQKKKKKKKKKKKNVAIQIN